MHINETTSHIENPTEFHIKTIEVEKVVSYLDYDEELSELTHTHWIIL